MKRYGTAAVIVLAPVLSACATQPAPPVQTAPGFLWGLLHGFIALLSLIGSVFWDIRIYAFPNNGGWYDFGFVLGAALFLAAAAERRSNSNFVVNKTEQSRARRKP